ncbi:MAG TPA: HAMP domain-containing sensor histidine kinase [Candidatus Limnocylindria bacterium]|nr:HAMP domain-containing sensor histidine kinase [Candidatus Limnocylindria bacterium]
MATPIRRTPWHVHCCVRREMPGRTRATAWDAAYEAERGAAIAWRTRWAAALCVLCLVVACADVALARPEAEALRLKFLGVFLALSVGIGLATLSPVGRRHPRPIAVAFGIGITLTLSVYGRMIPDGIAITVAALCATVMGLAILVPWGAVPQAILGGAVVVVYGGLWLGSLGDSSALLSMVVSASLVGVVGAAHLDRYRRTCYVQAWQQARLAAFGHELTEQAQPSDVAARLLAHAGTLIPADVCLVAQVTSAADGSRVVRVTHAGGDAPALAEQFLGFEVPCDSPLLADVFGRGVLSMPGDASDSELGRVFALQPDVRALYLALQRGIERLGVIVWTRRWPFADMERELAERLADPAALALQTARLLADLRETSRLKSEFVSTVSHELRTPLNVILGFADMARDPGFEPAERMRCLDRIEAAGRELLTLIESTLEVGKLEAQRSPVRIETVRLPAFWADLGQTCAAIPRQEGVRLEWGGPVPNLTISTDPHKLRVIIRNLVGNALKFTPQGHVRAALHVAGDRLVVSVADTGIGIRPEDQQVIFEMFRQGDGSDARRFGGTGLGLYIVRRFAEQLGASIELESAPGRGATFRVALPVVPAGDQHARRAA